MRETTAASAQPADGAPADQGGFVVEEGKRLSESVMFRLQRQFYDERGQGVWDAGIVPSYITNNPFIAQSYAYVVMAFLRDAMAGQGLDPKQPVYIVELSAGSGRFGYLFLKKLMAMKSSSALEGLDVRYVLTDFTMNNVKGWRAHPLLQPFLGAGVLELGLFDVTTDREIQLVDAGKSLSPETVKNPLVVLANYGFDSWPQDLFRVEQGKLHEVQVSLRHSKPTEPDLSQPNILRELTPSYSFKAVEGDYYGDPEIDRILRHYEERLPDTIVGMPIAAFQALRRLIEMASGRILLLTSDKAYTHEDQLSGLDLHQIQLHGGGFSQMVNFHAVGQFFENQGGLYACTSQRLMGLQTAAFVLGGDADRFRETLLAFHEQVDDFGPYDCYRLVAYTHQESKTIPLVYFLCLLRLSQWDPIIVHDCSKDALAQAHDAPEALKLELRLALERVWENFFPMGRDLAFELARFSLALKRPKDALRYGQLSLEGFGEHPVTYANLGIAHYYAENLEEALRCFDKSIALSETYATPKEWRLRVLAEKSVSSAP